MNVSRLAAWLARRPSTAVGMGVYFMGPESETIVQVWDQVPQLNDAKVSVVDLATEIIGIVQGDCDTKETACRYEIRWLTSTGMVASTTTLKTSPSQAGSAELARTMEHSDDASAAGVVGQSLRHNEFLVKMYMAGFQDILRKYAELAEYQQIRIRVLEATSMLGGEMEQETRDQEEQQQTLKLIGEAAKPILEAVLNHSNTQNAKKEG
jgi:hypothetical protein